MAKRQSNGKAGKLNPNCFLLEMRTPKLKYINCKLILWHAIEDVILMKSNLIWNNMEQVNSKGGTQRVNNVREQVAEKNVWTW